MRLFIRSMGRALNPQANAVLQDLDRVLTSATRSIELLANFAGYSDSCGLQNRMFRHDLRKSAEESVRPTGVCIRDAVDLARSVTSVLGDNEFIRALDSAFAAALADTWVLAEDYVARDLVSRLQQAQHDVAVLGEYPTAGARALVSELAKRAVCVAALLLSRTDRLRYAEEYCCELYELASVSRRAQWAYALRQLACSVPLRRELRRDASEAAGG